MKIQFADRTKTAISPIRKIFENLPQLNQQRAALKLEPIIDLSVGQPHIAPNPQALEGIRKRLADNESTKNFGYSPVAGELKTRQAIVDLYKMYYPSVTYTLNEVMFSHGANQALWNALSIFLQEKNGQPDIALTFEPYFSQYKSQITALGGQLITIASSTPSLQPSMDDLRATLTRYPQAKVLILNYPNNPSGKTLTENEIHYLVKILKDYPNLVLILDDVYRDLSFKPCFSLLDAEPGLKHRTIVINSGSKGLIGAPDLRIGIVAAPEAWIKLMIQQQLLTTAGVSTLSQAAFIAAVYHKTNVQHNLWEKSAQQEYQAGLQLVSRQLPPMKLSLAYPPDGGFYLLVDASAWLGHEILLTPDQAPNAVAPLLKEIANKPLATDIDIVSYLLYAAGVAVVPGSAFGLDPKKGLLRLSCAASQDQLAGALKRMISAYQLLKSFPKKPLSLSLVGEDKPIKAQKNLAIIGVGNVGEWVAHMVLQEILAGKLDHIQHIYYIGRHGKKLAAKLTDQLHALLIQKSFSSHLDHHNIDHILSRIHYTEDYAMLKNTELVITAFGVMMTDSIRQRSDLLLANDHIAIDIGKKLHQYANQATIVLNIANPLDVITWRIQQVSQLPKNQVIGVSGLLDMARFAQAIHEVAHTSYSQIDLSSLHVFGEHGPAMVPLLSQAVIAGQPLLEQLSDTQTSAIIHRTRTLGTQMMEALGKVPPHIGTAQAVLMMLQAIFTKPLHPFPCSVWNEYYQVWMGSPVLFTDDGIKVKPIPANLMEEKALEEAAVKIQADMDSLNHTEQTPAKHSRDSVSVIATQFFSSVQVEKPFKDQKRLDRTVSPSVIWRARL